MAAYRDFQNAWIKENRQTKYQISLFDPAFQKSEIAGSQETAEVIEHDLRVEELWKLIDEIFPDSTERRVVTLILNKVRSPEPYAHALGLSDVSHDDQLRQIRLVKYRITRRLRRRMAQQLYQTGG